MSTTPPRAAGPQRELDPHRRPGRPARRRTVGTRGRGRRVRPRRGRRTHRARPRRRRRRHHGQPPRLRPPRQSGPVHPLAHSLLLLASIASVTERLRLAAAAVLAPLRHPLLMARELGTLDLLTEGRLLVQPTVSWSADEYDALGVLFGRRGRLLDEHLAVWARAWGPSPISHDSEHYPFRDVYFEPKAYRPGGPRLWFGGQRLHGPVLRRPVRYGHGFPPRQAHPRRPQDAPRGDGRRRTGRRRTGDDRRHPGGPPRRPLPGGPRRRPRLDTGTAGTGLHDLLRQAQPVHRRPRRRGRLLQGRHATGGGAHGLTAR
ncbi:LLM class flavin-dependent oxidoreductase [Streptomyces phaeolivaceus]|uniref:LLM class flavin-dependent oxidoreductase n=1 Tax=Streptomyces phaeolivaceus TaxID=2653200 RepID=UPI001D052E74|nr:LLM class flavin-dependent oxidoreductase [Streptomyces phaeolivaceus]